ncbi:MAG: radical SAM family heme chaperone HemW [Hyphomicrobiales bacterium]
MRVFLTDNVHTAPDRGFGIYVHWPFCKAKCPYCDFNSHVRREAVDQRRFAAALLKELDWFAPRTPGRTVSSVFFGGGTPSLMDPQTVAAVIDGISARWPVDADVEISLEANPTSVEAERFQGYAAAGVTRVSLGVQALSNEALAALGRQHSVAEALAAFDIARRRFGRVSFDLIYARPRQSVGEWRAELSEALAIAVDHLSLYQLTIEPGTAYYDLHRRGKLHVPPDDLAAEFFEATQELCATAGLSAYEISNHARPGAACRHNLIYWRGGEWAGIGPGAHGRIGDGLSTARIGTSTEKHPESWLAQVEACGHGLIAEDQLKREHVADEVLLMGLRLSEGVDLRRYEGLGGHIDTSVRDHLEQQGLVEPEQGNHHLTLTPKGRLLTNTIIAALA